jgi:hypothetical protein
MDMDFLYISPEFPPNYSNFIKRLNENQIKVWGIGEADFYAMPEDLRSALKWYVQTNLNDIDAVQKAVNHLLGVKASLGQPGGFDWVESHNEQWLRLEGFINTHYGIGGPKFQDLDKLKKKSVMKKVFLENGLQVAKGERIYSVQHALELANQLNYPLILKPDEGVGAGGIYKVEDENQLIGFLADIKTDYLMEEFIEGKIVTYDGLTDKNGHVIFESSLSYGDGVLEYVLGKDPFFYVNRMIPHHLSELGKKTVKIFNIYRKFFHFEFFQVKDNYLPLEINCRPPGGPIIDMMNYSMDDDLYSAYAIMIAENRAKISPGKKFYCGYCGRKDKKYAYSHDEIVAKMGHCLVEHSENPKLFWEAMGNYRYIFRSQSESKIHQTAEYILKKF